MTNAHFPILSVLLWLPIAGALVVLLAGRMAPKSVRWLALFFSTVVFAISVPLCTGFNTGTASMQFVENIPWISTFNVHYHLGVDGISMPLILLNTFMTVLVVVAGWEVIQYKVAQYMAAFLIMDGSSMACSHRSMACCSMYCGKPCSSPCSSSSASGVARGVCMPPLSSFCIPSLARC